MPLFFFDIYNCVVTLDDEGQELPDLDAVRHEICETLPRIIHESVVGKDKAQVRIDVRDITGRRVLTSTAVMLIDCVGEPA